MVGYKLTKYSHKPQPPLSVYLQSFGFFISIFIFFKGMVFVYFYSKIILSIKLKKKGKIFRKNLLTID